MASHTQKKILEERGEVSGPRDVKGQMKLPDFSNNLPAFVSTDATHNAIKPRNGVDNREVSDSGAREETANRRENSEPRGGQNSLSQCPDCNGTGMWLRYYFDGAKHSTCLSCEGKGVIHAISSDCDHHYEERLSGVRCLTCGHFVGNWE